MSKALKNKTKLSNVVDVVADYGASSSAAAATNAAAFSAAWAASNPVAVYVPAAT